MRVALTYPEIDLTGGIERIVVECGNHLARRGHDVRVLGARWQPGVLDPRVRPVHVATRPRPDALHVLQYRRRATAALERLGPEVDVHASFGAQSPLGGVLWVLSVHRAAFELVMRRRSMTERLLQQANPYHRVRLWLERRMYRPGGYGRLIAPAPGVKDDLVRLYGVPDSDIAVQPLGFNPEHFGAERRLERRAEAREAFGYLPRNRVVLFVANELERKGFDTLLRGAARLGDADVRLLVVGRVNPAEVQADVARLGMTGRVRFSGSSGDVGFAHAAADAFALPTRYEPWGLVIVEALASGLPVLTSRLAGASVAVQEGVSGHLLDNPDDPAELASGLERLLAGGVAPPEQIAASVAWLAWDAVLERYEAILSRVAGSGQEPS